MPYVAGESLRDRLDREKQLPVADAVRIAGEVAGALDYAHRHGVIHRDIKPENILLHDGRALVADFGIALAASRTEGSSRMTETGMSLGTPHYMSPEQALGERTLDARTDVYALGCVLYEMLTGEPPFSGPTAQAIIAKVMSSEPEPVTALRKTVPSHVAGAIQRAIEKLPADRYASAAAFAAGLADSSTSLRAAAGTATGSRAAGPWRAVALAAGVVAVAAVGWSLLRPAGGVGPTEYDVGLPDSAAMRGSWSSPFSVSPAGDFMVYEVASEQGAALWYRGLLDATTHRINGSDNAHQPRISPDGTQIAFLRGTEAAWNVELMPVGGGRATVLAQGGSWANLEWLPDGRILLVEGDGIRARWLDPTGGAPVSRRIRYCILPTGLPDTDWLLCGGGGGKTAYRVDPRDSSADTPLWTATPDSAPVVGSHFRVIEGRYLTFVSVGGDLFAAPVDLPSGRVGRPVRMLSGLDRQAYSGEGTYEVSRSGTLVYAHGRDHAIGHMVRTDGVVLDTLPLGQEAFLRFSVSPDGQRLAAVVEVLDGEQLRVYDLATGRHQVLLSGLDIRQPVWSPGGDEILIQAEDSLFIGSPEASARPRALPWVNSEFEGFQWFPDGRVVGVRWGPGVALALQIDAQPITVDTIASDASFTTVAPDGQWVAYNSADILELWVEPLPRTGRRTQVAAGSMEDAQWLSPNEFVYTYYSGVNAFHRVTVRPGGGAPTVVDRRWFEAPLMIGTAGQSFALTPAGQVLYVQGSAQKAVPYLRVIPDWVERMKLAVDEANR